MTLRQRLVVWRRRWCLRRGHPKASWSPVALRVQEPDRLEADGTITPGDVYESVAWRCARHDRRHS